MKKVIISAIIAVVAGYTVNYAAIINIPADFLTIQEGIDSSIDGDTVLVQPGTYVENINFNGHNIVLASMYLMTEDTTYIEETVIDGDSSGSVIRFENDEDSTAVLMGFTVRNGYNEHGGGIYCHMSNPHIIKNLITSNLSPDGAGIYCWNAGPTIIENVITGNTTWFFGGYGGGIKCHGDSTPVIINNSIVGNQAVNGGGISCDGNALILGNKIIGNFAMGFEFWGSGGGINCSNSSAIISRNTINNNFAGFGGGLSCYSSDLSVMSNVFHGNSALSAFEPGIGGGIYCYESNPVIMNSSFIGNKADLSGGGIFCALVSNPVITNTIFWGDSASYSPEIDFDDSSSPSFRYCDIQGGWGGQGNIDTDPLFRDPENGDFHLMSTECGDPYDSPCIDTGSPAILDSLLDCSWGLGAILSDMGAYGGGDSVTIGIDNFVDLLPERLTLLQNHPNPFNSFTTIHYSLPEPSDVHIEIFDLLGQRVDVLFDGYKPAGLHSLDWNADDFPSGVYFTRLKSGDKSQNIKMVLLK